MKQKNEINTILQYAESSREWAGPLQSLGATDQIPEAMTTSVSYLCRLAYVYLRAALWGHDYEKYIGLTYEALRLAKKCQTQDKESMSVRCAAYVYYSEYLQYTPISKKFPRCQRENRETYLTKAFTCYEYLLKQDASLYDSFRYAYLLYRAAEDFCLTWPMTKRKRLKEEAFAQFSQILRGWKELSSEDQKRHERLFHKTCYNIGRCGLALLQGQSWLQKEFLMVLASPPKAAKQAERKQILRWVLYGLEEARKGAGLPEIAEDLVAVAHQNQPYPPQSGDIYYSLGKAYECAVTLRLSDLPHDDTERAERYYTYACEIDRQRRLDKQPVTGFTHMYAALFRLYYSQRELEKFAAAWQRYGADIPFTADLRTICAVRWYFCRGEYDRARTALQNYIDDAKWLPGLSEKKTQSLMDMIDTADSGSAHVVKGTYNEYQMRFFQRLAKQAQA